MLRSNRVPMLECLFCQRLDDEVNPLLLEEVLSFSQTREVDAPESACCSLFRLKDSARRNMLDGRAAAGGSGTAAAHPFLPAAHRRARGARGADGSRAAGRRKRSGGLKGPAEVRNPLPSIWASPRAERREPVTA